MIRYILVIAIVFMSTIAYSQSSNVMLVKGKTLTEQNSVTADNSSSFYIDFKNRQIQVNRLNNPNAALPADLVVEQYDWRFNRYAAPISFAYDFTGDGVLDPFVLVTGNTILRPNGTRQRYATVGFIDDFGTATYWPYGVDGTGIPNRTGWNSHVILDDVNGKAYLAIYDFLDPDGLIDDYLWEVDLLADPTTATRLGDPATALNAGWARFALDGNGNFWELADNSTVTNFLIALSTDGGSTFTVVDSIGGSDAGFFGTSDSNDPLVMAAGNKISIFSDVLKSGSLAELGLNTQGTTNPDSADGVYHYYSTDGGNSWSGEWASRDGQPVISNRPNYEQNFASFPFGSFDVDNTGVTHLVKPGLNSFTVVGPDTINAAPIVYWNDKNKTWISLERPAVETYPYDFNNLSVGNFNGPSLPVVKADASGNVVVAMWNLPQFSGEPGNSTINIYSATGQANKYFYDVVYAYSTNGGATWSAPEIATRVLNECNYWVDIAAVEVTGGSAVVHYTYFYDDIPGAGQLNENSFGTNGTWRYNTVSFPYTPATEIPVTFQVDMGVQAFEGNFPAGATVVVRGDFQAAFGDPGGDWQGNFFQLSDADGDTIYTGTFNAPAALAGNGYNHKFVIVNPPAGDNWESTPNRPFTVTAPSTTLPVVWFNDDNVYTVVNEVTNTINFTADISGILGVGVGGAFDPNQDSLLVMGLDWDNFGKNVVGNRRMFNNDPFNPGIYDASLTVTSSSAAPNGVGDSTKWKFKAYPDARFSNTGWESGSDRWHYYVADGSVIDLPVIVPRINPLFGALPNDVPVTFTVDMTGAVNRYNGLPIPLNELQFVGMRGGADFLGNWSSGGNWLATDTTTGLMKVLTNIGGNIWRRTTVVPAGTNAGFFELKFAAMYPGADTINGGSSPLDNEGGFGVNHSMILSDQPSGINLWYEFGNFDPSANDVKEIGDLVPMVYDLGQNYPNPFNPTTTIKFSIPEAGMVTLRVFNLLGQEVATLLNSEKTAGVYEASFDASTLSSGIYFYTLEAKNFTSTKKMVLLK